MLIRFLQRDAPWNAGEEVEFEDGCADKLLRHKVATLVDGTYDVDEGEADAGSE